MDILSQAAELRQNGTVTLIPTVGEDLSVADLLELCESAGVGPGDVQVSTESFQKLWITERSR